LAIGFVRSVLVKPETASGLEGLLDVAIASSSKPRSSPLPQELQALIRRMAAENRLWGQKRIRAELARLGFKVSARTVAKYMRAGRNRDHLQAGGSS
jgi:DNA-directed RNA polymerase specialized sigma54-like protein